MEIPNTQNREPKRKWNVLRETVNSVVLMKTKCICVVAREVAASMQ